ncbi:MAG: peptidoglycan-binding protein [Thermoleophilia bacterium]|nr:peptidoglycan-binding protein [Thermoleophilia bacterium]
MRRWLLVGAVVVCVLSLAPAATAASAGVAALQVALRAKGLYPGAIDGINGQLTESGVLTLQRRAGLPPDGRLTPATRRALGRLGGPLLGRRELAVGAVGWDVAALEFTLRRYGLPHRAVDGRFTRRTAAALQRFQRAMGLGVDGIAGPRTYRALASRSGAGRNAPPARVHVVRPGEGFYVIAARYRVDATSLARANGLSLSSVIIPGQRLRVPVATMGAARPRPAPSLVHTVRTGESFFSIAAVYHVSPWQLARVNNLSLTQVIVPGQRLKVPAGAHVAAEPGAVARGTVRESLDHWSGVYGVDPKLARALAWMESGFQQDVVSDVGALGVMQLLPETWEFVDTVLLGRRTPRTADGNVQAGVRYLRWQLDQFGGDARLALAGWYQGARAVRDVGLYEDTKEFVRIVLALYGTV